MLEPLTKRQADLIINNVVKAATSDIGALSKSGYNFLYLAPGFIAHFDRGGFVCHYGSPDELRKDILRFRTENQWHNFRRGEENYEYYRQRSDIYNAICAKLEAWADAHPALVSSKQALPERAEINVKQLRGLVRERNHLIKALVRARDEARLRTGAADLAAMIDKALDESDRMQRGAL